MWSAIRCHDLSIDAFNAHFPALTGGSARVPSYRRGSRSPSRARASSNSTACEPSAVRTPITRNHRGLRIKTHDLVAGRLVARDAVAAVGDQLLDQLGARGLVLDQHFGRTEHRLCCSRTARLRAGYSSRRRNRPRRKRFFPFTPHVVHTEKSLSSVALLAVSQLCTMRSRNSRADLSRRNA